MPTTPHRSTPGLRGRPPQAGSVDLTMVVVVLVAFFAVWAVVGLVLWLLLPAR